MCPGIFENDSRGLLSKENLKNSDDFGIIYIYISRDTIDFENIVNLNIFFFFFSVILSFSYKFVTISNKINANKREIKEIRFMKIENNEKIEERVPKEWFVGGLQVFFYYDEKSIQSEELNFMKLFSNIQLSPL